MVGDYKGISSAVWHSLFIFFDRLNYFFVGANTVLVLAPGVLAQAEACVLSKDEVLGSKPRYSSPIWCSW